MDRTSIRVLLVEDNPLHAHLMQAFLEQIGGDRFPLRRAGSLNQALELAREERFDVVLLDLVLPESRGLDTFFRWRSENPSTPVVVLSGLDDMELATRAVENGAQDYLLKSQINAAFLSRSIRYAVERARASGREWDSPLLRVAHQQLMKAAQGIGLEDRVRQGLLFPRRTQVLTLPFQRRGSAQETIFAYQTHHLAGAGPSLGGVRFHRSVSLGETAALSLWRSWKCALLGLPFSGSMGGVRVDSQAFRRQELEELVRRFVAEIGREPGANQDVLAPEVGTDEEMMGWAMQELKARGVEAVSAVGWDKVLNRGELKVEGLVYLLGRLCQELGLSLSNAKVVVHGSDYGGEAEALGQRLSAQGAQVIGLSEVGVDWSEVDCDIFIALAVGQQITAEKAAVMRCKIIVEAVDGATTIEADEILAGRGIEILPDLLANAAGVLVSYLEWRAAREGRALEARRVEEELRTRLEEVFERVFRRARAQESDLRMAALGEALERIRETSPMLGNAAGER